MIGILALAAAATSSSDAYSLVSLHEMGACIVDQTPWTARQVLALDYRTPEYAEKLKGIGTGVAGRCMRRASKFSSSGVLFAGSLAEALLRMDLTPKQLPRRIAFDPARELIEARSPGEEMALCTAFKAPEATSALLQTRPATTEEAQAIQELGPVLGECLQQGTTVEMNKPAVRAMLALAAYRIVRTPRKAGQ